MTIMPVETGAPAGYDAYCEAKEKLSDLAAEMGLKLIGWGAVPADPPKIKIEKDEAWICPHCGVISEDLEVMYVSDSQVSASPEDGKWRVSGPEAIIDNAAIVAYCCSNCCGWVQPESEVEER